MEEKELTLQDLKDEIDKMREIINAAKPDEKKGYSNEEIDSKFKEIMKHIDNVNTEVNRDATKPIEENEKPKIILNLFDKKENIDEKENN